MSALTLEFFQHNAFRILGISASATQLEIDQAARKMRLWDDPASIPPAEGDLAQLGAVPRTRGDIEQAVSRLHDPLARLMHRVWWPAGKSPADLPATAVLLEHNRAVMSVASLLALPPSNGDLSAYGRAIDELSGLADSTDYLHWLSEIENRGQFEKRATLDEIAGAVAAMPGQLVDGLLATAGNLFDDDAGAVLARHTGILRLLRGISPPQPGLSGTETDMVERLDDYFMRRCDLLQEETSRAWSTRAIAPLKNACRNAIAGLDAMVVSQLLGLVAQDPERRERINTRAARLLQHTAKAYDACYDYVASERALESALFYADGTALEPTLRQHLESTRLAARRQRLGAGPNFRIPSGGGSSGGGGSGSGGSGGVRAFASGSSGSRSGGSKWSGIGVIALIILLIRGIASFNTSSSTYDSHDTPPPKYFNETDMRNSEEIQRWLKEQDERGKQLIIPPSASTNPALQPPEFAPIWQPPESDPKLPKLSTPGFPTTVPGKAPDFDLRLER